MSYADQHVRSRAASIAVVAVVHLAIGYAFVSGLAVRVIETLPVITTVTSLPDDPPPPPRFAPPRHSARSASRAQPQPLPQPALMPRNDPVIATAELPPILLPQVGPGPGTVTPPPLPPARADLSRDAAPVGSHGAWVTSDDYPPQALREGAAGIVGIAVLVGTDGRVASCGVTASSGNPLLDEATCRVYSRRARFRPALDADGNPVTSHHADRIRWQIPA